MAQEAKQGFPYLVGNAVNGRATTQLRKRQPQRSHLLLIHARPEQALA